MRATSLITSHSYDRNLVMSYLVNLKLKQLAKLTEEILGDDERFSNLIEKEFFTAVNQFAKVNALGPVKEFYLGSSGLYVLRFRNATMHQGVEEDSGHLQYTCEDPDLN